MSLQTKRGNDHDSVNPGHFPDSAHPVPDDHLHDYAAPGGRLQSLQASGGSKRVCGRTQPHGHRDRQPSRRRAAVQQRVPDTESVQRGPGEPRAVQTETDVASGCHGLPSDESPQPRHPCSVLCPLLGGLHLQDRRRRGALAAAVPNTLLPELRRQLHPVQLMRQELPGLPDATSVRALSDKLPMCPSQMDTSDECSDEK